MFCGCWGVGMNISQAASASGLPIKTVRYYEEMGLVVPKRQAMNEYRVYSLDDVDQLRFLQRLRAAGFPLDTCRELLALYVDDSLCRPELMPELQEKVQHVDQQLLALNAIRQTLLHMINRCSESNDLQDAMNKRPPTYAPMRFTLIENAPD